eukprot:1048575-Amphidinium_carterae.1
MLFSSICSVSRGVGSLGREIPCVACRRCTLLYALDALLACAAPVFCLLVSSQTAQTHHLQAMSSAKPNCRFRQEQVLRGRNFTVSS